MHVCKYVCVCVCVCLITQEEIWVRLARSSIGRDRRDIRGVVPFISIDTANADRRDFTSPRRLTRERRSHFISLVGWHGYINL